MNAKHYVSLEAAKKLKELGYNKEVYRVIDEESDVFGNRRRRNQDLPECYWSCLTLLEAMDWLEERGIIIVVGWDSKTKKWFFLINRKEHLHVIYNSTFDGDEDDYTDRNECMQKAIEKAFELL